MVDTTIQELARVTVLNHIQKNHTIPVTMDDIHVIGFDGEYPYTKIYISVDGLDFYLFQYSYCTSLANADFLRTYKLDNSNGVRREVPPSEV
jgi:hypothetical protein